MCEGNIKDEYIILRKGRTSYKSEKRIPNRGLQIIRSSQEYEIK